MIIKSIFFNSFNKRSKAITRLLFSFSEQQSQKYIERPWQRQAWLSLNKVCSIKDAMQGVWLMSSKVLPFSYDTYQWACAKAVQHQPRLHKKDLLVMMRLGVQYGVRLSPLSEFLQNEIYLRIYRDYESEMNKYKVQLEDEIQLMYAEMEAKSKDYFELLKAKENEQLSKQVMTSSDSSVKQKDKIVQDLIELKRPSQKSAKQLKKKQFELQDLLQVAELLRRWGSKNLLMIQYLQQLLTVMLDKKQVEAPTALIYIRFLTFTCESLFSHYYTNKDQYTARSIKRIRTFQEFYYYEHFRQLITAEKTSSVQFLQELIKEYSRFPIKKRSIRKRIGIYLCSQMKKFKITHREDIVGLLLSLNQKDEKLKNIIMMQLGLKPNETKIESSKNEQKSEQQEEEEEEEEGEVEEEKRGVK